MKRKRLIGAGCLVVLLVIVVVLLSRPGPTLEPAHEAIGSACPDPFFDGHMLLVVVVEGEDWVLDCLSALQDAAVIAGITRDDVGAVLGGSRTSVETNGVRLSVARHEPVDRQDRELSFIELADCERTVVPLDPDDWSRGVPWDRFWYSRCDTEPDVEVRPLRLP